MPRRKEELPLASLSQGLHQALLSKMGAALTPSFKQFIDSYIGVPIGRNLALQWLLGTDTILTGKMVSIVGPPKSNKSHFCYGLIDHYIRAGGMGVLLSSEPKTNVFSIAGVMHRCTIEEIQERVHFVTVPTLESLVDAFTGVIRYLETVRDKLKGQPMPPFMVVLDSLGMLITAKEREIRLKGKEGQGYQGAKDAYAVQQTLKAILAPLDSLPITVAFINHQHVDLSEAQGKSFGKPQQQNDGPKKKDGGGVFKDFAYIWKMEVESGNRYKTIYGPEESFRLKMIANTFSRLTGKSIPIRKRSLFCQTSDGVQEKIWFDWHKATGHLLASEHVLDDQRELVERILGKVTCPTSDTVTCSSLGMTKVSLQEFGKRINHDPELFRRLQNEALFIKRFGTAPGASLGDNDDTTPADTVGIVEGSEDAGAPGAEESASAEDADIPLPDGVDTGQ